MTVVEIDAAVSQSQLAGIGILVAFVLTWAVARWRRFPTLESLAGLAVPATFAVIGARLWSLGSAAWHGQPLEFLAPTGFASAGAFAGAAVALGGYGLLFGRKPLWRLLDVVTSPALVGLAFTRLGCLFEGCHRGAQASGPIAVVYTDAATAVHPFGAYLGGGTVLVALVALVVPTRVPGARAALAILGYGAVRFCAEFFREPGELFALGPFHTGHVVAIGVFAAGSVVYRLAITDHRTAE